MNANNIPFPAMQPKMLKKISMNPSPYLFRDTIEHGPTFSRNTLGSLAHYLGPLSYLEHLKTGTQEPPNNNIKLKPLR